MFVLHRISLPPTAIHMKLKHPRLNNCMNVNLKMRKKLIEELAREKSRLEIDAEKANAEAQDALAKYVECWMEFFISNFDFLLLDLRVKNEIYVLLKVV